MQVYLCGRGTIARLLRAVGETHLRGRGILACMKYIGAWAAHERVWFANAHAAHILEEMDLLMPENEVIYRDFCEDDINDVAILLANIWYPELSGQEASLAGKMDLARFAAKTSYMRVACLDGSVIGIAAVRAKDSSEKNVLHWQKFYDSAVLHLRNLDPKVAQEILDYHSFEKKKA